MKIYLDNDGVLANFIQGAANLFKVDYDSLLERWPPGLYDMEELLGKTREEFLSHLKEAGEDYWINLPTYHYSNKLYEFCSKIAPTLILTAPTDESSCLNGKMKWFRNNFGKDFDKYIITVHKFCCARHDSLLVDDKEENVDKFIEHGGSAILFPAVSNKRYALRKEAFEVVKDEIVEWQTKIMNGVCQQKRYS